ncbi:transposase-like protein [Pullulanibacillus pueri]|uniref:IS66 family insertion sequence element accessory protein TnpB n=2 Tax=Pullulanibacillus pueri TaxID=1437324 RepID=A0A8J2ZZW6_9BACL|nr:IS66 family insertion sequence element accessory protein TnpB [Pullulanibacillus pueri]MBM7684273.1 transposase-like protein [Pullulanibacillus pueri]GGH89167.1 hypothetical protein GCM10007096_43140 [Pullulanibacillus pueri]
MSLTDKRIEWKARFDTWKTSGLSVAEWCEEQDIKRHQMYYWVRKFENEMTSPEQVPSETQWLTVSVKDEQKSLGGGQESVLIHFRSISVEVRPGANMALLSDVVHVLQNQC